MIEPSCFDCKFYKAGLQPGRGYCRRYPSVVQKEPMEWCGEFQPKE